MTPRISLLICTYNKLSYLRGTLLALQLLDFPGDQFEVIVQDDGSTDATDAFLAEFEPGYTLRWATHANAGRAAARNAGARMVRGELLVIIDDDCLLHPSSLSALWDAYQAHPDHLLISSVSNVGTEHVPAVLETLVREGVVRWDGLYQFMPVDQEYALADLMRRMRSYGLQRFAVPWVVAQGLAITLPAAWFRRLAGFDERFVAYGMEDFDLAFRFHELGGRFLWVAPSVVFHLDHGHDRNTMFKESTITSRTLYEKFPERVEIRQFIKFLCGAVSFKDFNNSVAAVKGMPPIDGFIFRFSPYGMIRYRDQMLEERGPADQPARHYSKSQDYRLRLLIERISRDMAPELANPPAAESLLVEPGKSVLVVAPHMDDEVIGCGGLIHRFSQAGSSVTVLFLTDGAMRNLPHGEYSQLCRDRRAESERAADILGVERCIYLNIPERNLATAALHASPVARVLEECRPDIILVPSALEHHPDHRVAYHWLCAAVRIQAAQPQILCYEVCGSCKPDRLLVLDGATWERKVSALAEYATQLGVLDYQRLMSFMNETRGRCALGAAPAARAEGFRTLGALAPVLP